MTADITTPSTKPGYQTTEFWLATAAKLLGILFASGAIGDGSALALIAGLAATVLAALGYTVSRTLVKTAGVLLVVLAVGTTQSACSGASPRERAAAGVGAFLDCESPHVDAQMLEDAKVTAKSAIRKWIRGDGTIDTAGLRADVQPLRSDLLKCAYEGAIAALLAPVAPQPGAAMAAPMAVDVDQVRAAWAQVRGELGWPAARAGG